jgi:hypothetical protein
MYILGVIGRNYPPKFLHFVGQGGRIVALTTNPI